MFKNSFFDDAILVLESSNHPFVLLQLLYRCIKNVGLAMSDASGTYVMRAL